MGGVESVFAHSYSPQVQQVLDLDTITTASAQFDGVAKRSTGLDLDVFPTHITKPPMSPIQYEQILEA